ncbi:MAG: rhodanese-like domain-containing protein [Dehalococcoidia bacterium]
MSKREWQKIFVILTIALLLVALPLLAACGDDEDEEPQPTATETQPTATEPEPTATEPEPTATETEPAEVSEFDIIQAAVADYCAQGPSSISNADLNDLISAEDAPTIVSIRSEDAYNAGHIRGAENMAFGELTTLPNDEEVVLYCYTGQGAGFATGMLNVLGYEAKSLSHGMSSWTKDPDVYVSRFSADTAQMDFRTETEPNEPTQTYDYPDVDNTDSSDAAEILMAAAENVSTSIIAATDLNDMIANDEAPFIVSVRKPDAYAAGHIPGAINIGWGALADNLDKLPPDEPIVVYCYTGQSAAQATAMLQMLGYDAQSLKFGMCSWTQDEAVNMGVCFDPDTKAMDLPVE